MPGDLAASAGRIYTHPKPTRQYCKGECAAVNVALNWKVSIAMRHPIMTPSAGGLLAIALSFACGCDRKSVASNGRAEAPVSVEVKPSVARDTQRYVDVVGTLYGNEDATIAAKVAGRITGVFKDLGDPVAPAEALAQIQKIDYELAQKQKENAVQEALAKLGLTAMPARDFDAKKLPTVERARLQVENARQKYDRGVQLHEQKLLSDQDFTDLETALAVVQRSYDVEILTAHGLLAEVQSRTTDLEVAKQHLQDTTLLAPGGGDDAQRGSAATSPSHRSGTYHVSARYVSVGEYVKEGQQVYRLVADDPMKLRALVPERFVAEVRVGQTVHARVDAYGEADFPGRIVRINPQIDPANRTFQIEVLIPNADHRLKAGSFARGRVDTVTATGIVFVAQEAVVSFAGINKVFTIKDGKASEQPVELGERVGDQVEIIRGLSAGTPVVVKGNSKLATGMAVSITPANATTSSSTQPERRAN